MKGINRLYRGMVYHARHTPFFHDFRYRVFTCVIDWSTLPKLSEGTKLFSLNRWNMFSIHFKDHGLRDGSDPAIWITQQAQTMGISVGRIVFQGFPRIMGYVFNPLSLFYIYDKDGVLRAVMHQVKNTFGGQHCYLLKVKENSQKQTIDKKFHVSPFIGMECVYHFTVTPPDGERFFTAIHQAEGEDKVLTATWSGDSALPFTDQNLSTLFLTIPFLSLKIILAIHWQALRLFLKGAKYRSGPNHPDENITLG